jgi:hypothetical protein
VAASLTACNGPGSTAFEPDVAGDAAAGTPAAGAPSLAALPPPSTLGVTFDWSTYVRLAPGSDNWPMTWADDGHQYTTWGDGGGFGGTNQDGRVRLGVGRVEGGPDDFEEFNVWGGKNPENRATFKGKSYGILALGPTLYMLVYPPRLEDQWKEARLYKSTNRGASWTATSVLFTSSTHGIGLPFFLQFGQAYAGARDDFVYVYGTAVKNASFWGIQKPGEILLLRVPRSGIEDRSQYRWFAGFNSTGAPVWSSQVSAKKPVFQDANGVMRNSANYNAGLRRYLLVTCHTADAGGNIGIFDAPEPWGPWRTVLYQRGWRVPGTAANTYYWNFASKWFSADGRDFTLVHTGVKSNDAWNSVRGRFTGFP